MVLYLFTTVVAAVSHIASKNYCFTESIPHRMEVHNLLLNDQNRPKTGEYMSDNYICTVAENPTKNDLMDSHFVCNKTAPQSKPRLLYYLNSYCQSCQMVNRLLKSLVYNTFTVSVQLFDLMNNHYRYLFDLLTDTFMTLFIISCWTLMNGICTTCFNTVTCTTLLTGTC